MSCQKIPNKKLHKTTLECYIKGYKKFGDNINFRQDTIVIQAIETTDYMQNLIEEEFGGEFAKLIWHKVNQICGVHERKPTEQLRLSQLSYQGITDRLFRGFQPQRQQYFLHLQRLDIVFDKCHDITDRDLYILSSSIGRDLINLKQLKMSFAWCQYITDQGLKTFGQNLAKNTFRLGHLTLAFRQCHKFSDTGLQRIGAIITRQLNSLKELAFTLENCSKISDIGLEGLLSQINQARINLESFEFNVGMNNGILEPEWVVNRKFTSLQRLKLSFSWCKVIDDNTVKGIATILIPALVNLKQLSLNFSGCQRISNQGLVILAQSLSIHLPDLHHLNLSFALCYKISNKGLDEFGNYIKLLTKLTSLQLNFAHTGWENNISDKGFDCLVSHISNSLTSLKHLDLRFEHRQITQEAFEKAVNKISTNLINLQKLTILVGRTASAEILSSISLNLKYLSDLELK